MEKGGTQNRENVQIFLSSKENRVFTSNLNFNEMIYNVIKDLE